MENNKKEFREYNEKRTALMFVPTCKYCGNTQLPLGEYDSQAQADEAATTTCKCFDAREYQRKIEKAKEREDNIVRLREKLDDFSTYCESRGVSLEGDLYDTIFNAGVSVLDCVVTAVTFKFTRMRVSITENAKGTLVISFTYSDGAKVEV